MGLAGCPGAEQAAAGVGSAPLSAGGTGGCWGSSGCLSACGYPRPGSTPALQRVRLSLLFLLLLEVADRGSRVLGRACTPAPAELLEELLAKAMVLFVSGWFLVFGVFFFFFFNGPV